MPQVKVDLARIHGCKLNPDAFAIAPAAIAGLALLWTPGQLARRHVEAERQETLGGRSE
jgi:hypothetical protein